jgi:hypothetical protein
MKTFIQLKDNVAWAYIDTESETDGIEVESGTGESYINKKYENGSWSDAEKIYYAEIDSKTGRVFEIKNTYFISEVKDNVIMPANANSLWSYIDGSWVEPQKNELIVPKVFTDEEQDPYGLSEESEV